MKSPEWEELEKWVKDKHKESMEATSRGFCYHDYSTLYAVQRKMADIWRRTIAKRVAFHLKQSKKKQTTPTDIAIIIEALESGDASKIEGWKK